MTPRILFTLLIIVLFPYFSQGQITSTYLSAGGGIMNANSQAVDAWFSSLGFDYHSEILSGFDLRLGLLYLKDYRSILPKQRTIKYLSYLRGVTAQLLLSRNITSVSNIEYSFGLLYLNDRIYSDKNEHTYGAVFSASIGLDLFDRMFSARGFVVGVGSEYGFTFTKTQPKYGCVFIRLKYVI